MRQFLQARLRSRDARGAAGDAAQCGDPLGDIVDRLFEFLGELVEQLVQGDEIRAFDIPVRLLDLGIQIQRVGELPLSRPIMLSRSFGLTSMRVVLTLFLDMTFSDGGCASHYNLYIQQLKIH